MQLAFNQDYTCENLKLLEVVMEHLLFHWDDIVDVLLDELLTEEVNERNQIEAKLQGQHHQQTNTDDDELETLEERQQRILDRKR